MVQNLLTISIVLCSCLWLCIISLSSLLWRTPRLCPWPYPFQHVHHTSQHSHLSQSLNHHLYRDDTQFISFTPKTFTTATTQLQDTIFDISSWMTANLLSLNPSKTEFILIGLPQQISKISNPSLSLPSNHPITPTDSARNLGFIFDSSITFLNRFHLYPVLATITSVTFAASGTLSTSKQHPLSLLLSYILN